MTRQVETAEYDDYQQTTQWPEWRAEFYQGNCPPQVYRVPYNENGFVPLFFVGGEGYSGMGYHNYSALKCGTGIIKHMARHDWFPLVIFDTKALQNLCKMRLERQVLVSDLLRLLQSTEHFNARVLELVDMLVGKSREIDNQGWSNVIEASSNDPSNNFNLTGLYTPGERCDRSQRFEFRVRRLLSNWFCIFPYHEDLANVPGWNSEQHDTRLR
jgi:hypothetical protein